MKSILLNYARPCSGKNYFKDVIYDRDIDMSVVVDGGKKKPFIEVGCVNMSVMTKTEAAREQDDTLPMILAITTKTFTQRETDDQGPFNN